MEILENKTSIEDRIFTIRGRHVMLDRDLAQLYGVETKALNQAVKRNIERFSPSFMFMPRQEELSELVTICDRFDKLKHSSVMPHVFTEQGVAMLSGILKSTKAVEVNIKIMRAFVLMRNMVANTSMLNKRVADLETKQGIFFDGQIYDAYTFVADLVRKAVSKIVLIDNYIDDTVLTLMDKRAAGVEAVIYTSKISKQLLLDIDRHNEQYPPIGVHTFTRAHDRFLIIDNAVYLVGASIKDLGKKWFGFTLMENADAEELLWRM